MNKHTSLNRIELVCDYISHHLDQELNLDILSEVGACSKYHFHRIFKAYMGISAIQYVQMARLKRASFRLAFEPKYTITDIAYEANFDSPEAFSRAFSRIFAQTPSQFRARPDWHQWHARYDIHPPKRGNSMLEVQVVDFAERNVALIEHYGHPSRVLETAGKFIQWRKTTGLSPIDKSETFGIPYSDPSQTAEEEFRFDICGTHQGEVPENEFGVKAGIIPAGRCAMAIHKGSLDRIGETIYQIYQGWLVESGEETRDFPCFFRYLNFVHQVDECDLETEVYIPLK
ncbi:AraC family transcriptional regulator [Vibrio galatheae]|uniref:AraC family transcriptional regulator n=1 Tax=Vibrio galatheae TaxID=579748 RepID=A0A0F4NHK9_9VIBR|nr:AraC family transcriptional regulator [Vibrio galatheae]KJY82343.1 AraC family transcriptional regulator [Vibrio galatheae]